LTSAAQLNIPFAGDLSQQIEWPNPDGTQVGGTVTPHHLDSSTSPVKAFHSRTYVSMGAKAIWAQKEDTNLNSNLLGSNEPAWIYYVGTLANNNLAASRIVANALSVLRANQITPSACLHDDGSGNGPDYPGATSDCYYVDVVFGNGTVGAYFVQQNQNAVNEMLLEVNPKFAPPNSDERSSFFADAALMNVDAITITNNVTATDDASTGGFMPPPPSRLRVSRQRVKLQRFQEQPQVMVVAR
jgi:hypothetical protein